MKTYYIHGKITPTSFHLQATLLNKPPKGYYSIGEQIADSIHQSIRLTVEQCSLQPRHGKEIEFGLNPQATFLQS